jgi:hypothetical protein
MTRIKRFRFRRLVVVGALGAGAIGLAIGTTAAAANAATAGGYPTPSPTPTVHHSPAPRHHKPRPEVVCFFSLETEHDAIPGVHVSDQGGGYNAPSTAAAYGQQGNAKNGEEAVEVVQLVKVCVTEEHGRPESVTVVDESKPYAWIDPASGPAPTPNGLPDSIGRMLTTG